MIHQHRIQLLNDQDIQSGDTVIYWMQQSQRAHWNHALEFAIREANRLDKKIAVVFGLTDRYPEANWRHYQFMLEGLREVRETLADRGIRMIFRIGAPDEVALSVSRSAAMIVCDRGYLRHQREWRQHVAQHAPCRVVQVESDAVVPVQQAADKQEYAARFIRPKLNRLLDRYFSDLDETEPHRSSLDLEIAGEEWDAPHDIIKKLNIDKSVKPVSVKFVGGTREAIRKLDRFLQSTLEHYRANRNQPQTDAVSHMGMYLHIGQISPLFVARKIQQMKSASTENRDAYLEELIVRRELAVNYVYYQTRYDSFDGLPEWAQKTLQEHAGDTRPSIYSPEELENAQTHDPYWNAAANEMKYSGYMHNYMRMYWVKKIIEWSETPQDAYQTALHLNNKYFLDGRDPSSYAGVSWGFGLHDRPWKERPVFGKIRYMNAAGLKRKCDIQSYVDKVGRLHNEKNIGS